MYRPIVVDNSGRQDLTELDGSGVTVYHISHFFMAISLSDIHQDKHNPIWCYIMLVSILLILKMYFYFNSAHSKCCWIDRGDFTTEYWCNTRYYRERYHN